MSENTPGLDALIAQFKDHPDLEPPEVTYDRLRRALSDLAARIAADGEDVGNGLTAEENLRLIRSEDEREIRTLLAKGIERSTPATA